MSKEIENSIPEDNAGELNPFDSADLSEEIVPNTEIDTRAIKSHFTPTLEQIHEDMKSAEKGYYDSGLDYDRRIREEQGLDKD